MAAGLRDLFETIMSFTTELGGFAVGRGGKSLAHAAAVKVGWADKKAKKKGRIRGHSLSGHRMSAGFGHGLTNSYDPKKSYQNATLGLYKKAALSGTGLAAPPIEAEVGSNGRLRRGTHIQRYQAKDKPKQTQTNAGLKNSVALRNVKF